MRTSEISIIIPTKDRPDDLRRCMESILGQKGVFPKEVIIVDCSLAGGRLELSAFSDTPFPVKRIETELGLTRQRNIGVRSSKGNVIAFLDDDCVVEKDYVEAMEAAYKSLPEAGGLHGVIVNQKKKSRARDIFEKIFFLAEIHGSGKLRNSGAPSFLDQRLFRKNRKPLRTDMLHGCGSSYRRLVFERGFFFDESLEGYCLGEDYEFSYRVSRHFSLYLVPGLRFYHMFSEKKRLDLRELYRQYLINVFIFWKKYRSKNSIKDRSAFMLYMTGTLLRAFVRCAEKGNLEALAGWKEGARIIMKDLCKR